MAAATRSGFPYRFDLRNSENDETLRTADASLILAHGRWSSFMHEAVRLTVAGHHEAALAPASEAIRLSADVHPQYHFLESGLHTALGGLHLRHGEYGKAKRHFDRAVFLHHDNAVALAGLEISDNERLKAQELTPPPVGGRSGGGREDTSFVPICPHPSSLRFAETGPNPPPIGEGAILPPYTHAKAWAEWLAFCGVAETELKSGIFEAWAQAEQAEKDAAISLFSHAITLCDATHRQYHALAAEPWWLRAALHRALDEPLLAMNDLKRGLDLDRQNGWALAQLAELKELP